MAAQPASWWFTLAELAAMKLPGLPADTRKLRDFAAQAGWSERAEQDGTPLARRRSARGGGTEYHAGVLPLAAQEVLLRRRNREEPAPIAVNDTMSAAAELADWFARQPDTIKNRAKKSMAILAEVNALVELGNRRTAATESVARKHGVSPRAIAGWHALVAGFPRAQWLPRLAPQYKGGGKLAEIDPEALRLIKSDYLRPEKPSFASVYNRVLEDYCQPRGLTLPPAKTLKNRVDREVLPNVKKLRRDGREVARKMLPSQRRTVADLHAMQAVNADGHTFDVFVRWDDGRIGRPVMVGIQDIYSRKLLAWRIDRTESTLLTRLAFADLFRNYGIPNEAVLDNGRALMSKALTGGQKTRWRFKIKDSDPTGVLTSLGITVHPTLPYRGSSKPIERAWKDLCETIAKHPAVAGAYTGNKPGAKPENYGERAIPIAEFEAHVARQIANHNARPGRQTETAKGRSFDETFKASYAASIINKASEADLRLALLEAGQRRCDKANGSIKMFGNVYWSAAMNVLAGRDVTVRFNPDELHSEVHIYLKDGRYFGAAECIQKTGFFDQAAAKRRAKQEADYLKATRELVRQADLLDVSKWDELVRMPIEPEPEPPLVAAAVRPVRHRGHSVAAQKLLQERASEPAEQSSDFDFSDAVTAGINRLRIVE